MITQDYKLLSKDEKTMVMLGIADHLSKITEFSHPYTYAQLSRDEAKVNLIKNVINAMYGTSKNMDIPSILDGFESASLSAEE